jgi:hypothetical protein
MGQMIAPQAVRGTEQQMLSQASGLPGVQAIINRWTNSNGQFAPTDMPAMLKMVDNLYAGQAATAAKIADQFRLRAESNKGVNADDIVNPRIYPRDLAERAAKGSAPVAPMVWPPPAATAAAVAPAPATKPTEPVPPPKYTADWANSFETPQALGAALLALKPPDLLSIPQSEVNKMTPQQRDVLTGVVRKRTHELMPAG